MRKKKIINPQEKICLLLYEIEQNSKYLSEKLYSTSHNSNVTRWISQLVKKEWIKEKIKKGSTDGRIPYYKTSPNCFFQGSKNKFLGIELTDEETKSIINFLHSKIFRDAFIRIINTNLSKNELPDFSLVKELLCFYSLYVFSLEKFIACKKGELVKDDETNTKFPGYADVGEDTYCIDDEEIVKKYLSDTMKSIFGFEDDFLINFLTLDWSLREKLTDLLSPSKKQMLMTFFHSIASVVDTFDNNLDTKN